MSLLDPDCKESHGALLKAFLLGFIINLTLKTEAVASVEIWSSRFYNFNLDPLLALECHTAVSHRPILFFLNTS